MRAGAWAAMNQATNPSELPVRMQKAVTDKGLDSLLNQARQADPLKEPPPPESPRS